jgi:hypothetical protein
MSILLNLFGDLLILAISLCTFALVYVICNHFHLPEPYEFIVAILWSCYPMGMSVVRQVVSGFYTSSYLATHQEDI